jgi:diacylglycerol kinase family enzyme
MPGAAGLGRPENSPAFPGGITCILNGSAGSHAAGQLKERIAELFASRGARATILVAEDGKEIPNLAKRALEQQSSLIVAVGGDGTVNCVASVVLNSQAILGVLPAGTLNHFAKDLGIPVDLPGAVETLLSGEVGCVDVGEVNGRLFLNNSSLGLYPAIVRQREDLQKKGHAKWSAFAAAAAFALMRYQHLHVEVHGDDGTKVEEETPFVFIGNNRYCLAGLRLGAREELDAGELWVYRAPRASRISLLRLALRALFGRQDHSELAVVAAKSFRISTRRRHIHVATDGEVTKMNAPLNYSIRPKALAVVVPRTQTS